MLRNVLFDLSLFDKESDRENSQKRVLVLLEALTLCNQFYLQEHPETPLIYQSGIRYKMPAQFESGAAEGGVPGYKGEVFRDIPRIIENGGGDCDNVASWRAAELRHRLGVAAKPYITWRKRDDGGTTYHVIVIWPDGSSEDPSLLLGMPKDDGGKGLREEHRKLGERAGEMLDALSAPAQQKILGDARRRSQLEQVTGLILGGRGRGR
jgi:hypothetical protein